MTSSNDEMVTTPTWAKQSRNFQNDCLPGIQSAGG